MMSKVVNKAWMQKTVIGLMAIFSLWLFNACDPNGGYTPQPNPPAPNPIVSNRTALIGCQSDPISSIGNFGRRSASGAAPILADATGGQLGSGTAVIKVVSINPSGAYNYFYGRNYQSPNAFNGGVSAYVTNRAYPIGADPEDIVFTPDGRLALVALKGSNQVAAFAVDAGANLRLYGVFNVPRPISIATDDRTAFIVSERRRSVFMMDLSRRSAYDGTQLPRMFGGELRLSYNGDFELKKAVIGLDIETGDENKLYVAATGPTGGIFEVDIDVARGEELPDFREVTINVDPLAAYNGVEQKIDTALTQVNLFDISATGLAVGNDVTFGPRPFGMVGDYAIASNPLTLALNTGGLYPDRVGNAKDISFTADGSALIVLTDKDVRSFDTRHLQTLGYQKAPIRVANGRGNSRLAVDKMNGEFAMVMTPSDNSFSILRLESGGNLSYNGAADTISTAATCIGPTVAAIQPKYARQEAAVAAPTAEQQQQQAAQVAP